VVETAPKWQPASNTVKRTVLMETLADGMVAGRCKAHAGWRWA
jgi:hypothetical protein